MAKISIDDKSLTAKQRRIVLNPLIEGVTDAFERLGSAKEMLEVVKISFDKTVGNNSHPLAKVKLVISGNGIYGDSQVKIEREFGMLCKDNMVMFIAQGVIRTFQEMVVDLANQLDRRASELRNALATLGMAEKQAGNDFRCRICGYLFSPEAKKLGTPCPECAKCSCSAK
jgi:predicted Zn-ribbon and HTH transcriptional regulator